MRNPLGGAIQFPKILYRSCKAKKKRKKKFWSSPDRIEDLFWATNQKGNQGALSDHTLDDKAPLKSLSTVM